VFQEIIDVLNTPVILSIDDLAEKLNSNKESVIIVLEQLNRMGYIEDISSKLYGNNQCSKTCEKCGECKGNLNKIATHIYSIP